MCLDEQKKTKTQTQPDIRRNSKSMVQMLNIQNKSQITIIISAIIIQIIPALLKTITTTTTIKTNSLFRKKKQLSNKYKLLYAFHFENFLQYLSQHIWLHVPAL